HRVERLIERKHRRVGFDERDVAEPAPCGASPRRIERRCRAISADDFAGVADDIRRQKCHVAGAAPAIEDAHPRPEACALEETARSGIVDPRLRLEPCHLLRRVPEYVGPRRWFAHAARVANASATVKSYLGPPPCPPA